MKILVVDDNHSTHVVVSATLESNGHEVISVYDGMSAVEMLECVHPDIILMDVMMPRMNGLEAAKEIKKRCGHKFVPIIFVTAVNSSATITQCIECGGDDYIVKPIEPAVLLAKISVMTRICAICESMITQRLSLENELDVANHVFETIVDKGRLELPYLNYHSQPVSRFCSDLLMVKETPMGGVNFLLADFGGYGLSAAMSSIPVLDIFYSMSNKGFSVDDIVVELNNKLKSIFPEEMYCAALLISIDFDRSSLSVWNGGMPDILVTSAKGKVVNRVPSSHLPLGVESGGKFDSCVSIMEIDKDSRVYLMSDGVLEQRNTQGQVFECTRLEKILLSDQSGLIPRIFDELKLHANGGNQVDDMTIAEICIQDIDIKPNTDKKEKFLAKAASTWSVSMSFDALTLRDLNVVPIILNLVMDVQAPVGHRERLFTIVSELFNNALEHGVLKLESTMKLDPNGFVAYYEARACRLAALTDALITVDLKNEPLDEGGRLTIVISDSGAGFDYNSSPQKLETNLTLSGRGIPMVDSLCASLEYSGIGNIVTVVYDWT